MWLGARWPTEPLSCEGDVLLGRGAHVDKAPETLFCWTRGSPANLCGSVGARGQAASPSQSRRLRLGSHKITLPCLFRFLPAIQTPQEEMKQPRAPSQPSLELPACVPGPSGTVRPRDLPALRPILGSGLG